ncbi:hypothetical protein [Halopiger xanaduensis]|uniref:Uncharacterized protein n=1 Tax=Halopiger xanaduensis (strain DSM 18323 / JCM 14033 / SH-6) TaxID=797210 RepID=F8D4Q9_HALXS|nr:hypothetical protein [Halopiger xanaduensis]AEH37528.1 hypothetical protein Halxa_2912 [Halopiger xanaduensis SH-6]
MTGISISIGDTTVSVEGAPDDDLTDVSRALHAELDYLSEHHPALIVEVSPSADQS